MPDLDNYKNMSMESLGKSLLSQQASNRSRSRRKSRKKEKISKALAILLGGQAIFNRAIQDRSKELDSFNTIMARKNKKFVAEMKVIGNILDSLPTELIDSKDAYQQYLNSPSLQRAFRTQVRPLIASAMQKFDKVGYDQAVTSGTITGDLNKIIDGITAPYFLKAVDGGPSRAQQVLDAGEKYFEGIDRDEVAENLFGITEGDVEANQALRLKAAKEDIRKGTNWFSVPGMLGKVFKGEATNFRALETGDYSQSDLMTVFDKTINIGEFITPNFSEVMKSWDNNKNYINMALGIEEFMNTSPQSRQARAMDRVIRKSIEDLNEAKPEDWTQKDFDNFRLKRFKELEEAMALKDAIYDDTPTELDVYLGREIAKTWGGLRILLDNPDREAAVMLENRYGVDLSTMNLEAKDQLAMRIILAEGVDPFDPANYEEAFGKPNYADKIPGRLELFEAGERKWELGREGVYNESNFINNLSKIQAYLTPTFKGVSADGIPEVSDPIAKVQETGDVDKVGGANVTNTLNTMNTQNAEFAEATLAAMLDNNETFAQQVRAVYPTTLDAQQALMEGTFSLEIPQTTMEPVDQQMQEVGAESWRDPYSARKDIYAEGQTGVQVVPGAIYDAGVRQFDRQALTTIERHLTGRVNDPSGYQAALTRLGMSDEEARQQFSVQ